MAGSSSAATTGGGVLVEEQAGLAVACAVVIVVTLIVFLATKKSLLSLGLTAAICYASFRLMKSSARAAVRPPGAGLLAAVARRGHLL